MATLTIFTPTYNRAYCLPQGYKALCRQTCKDFVWLIIDDGSTDDTRHLVEKWIAEGKVDIKYHYQENQGMHGAHNAAYRLTETELNTCIDSDDYMPDDAVEKIISFWKSHGSEKHAGIIGLDIDINGKIIGKDFPVQLKETTLTGYYMKGGWGDKKLVYRTDVIKKYPEYPLFEGEKYFSLAYKYNLIDNDYELLTLNEPLVVVDYQADGSSHIMYKQYWNNPKGFMYLRLYDMKNHPSTSVRFRSHIHYISHCIRARQYSKLLSTPHPFITFLVLPLGMALYFLTLYKVKTNQLMKIR